MFDVQLRDVPEQLMVTEQRMVDQAGLEEWLPGAMARVAKAAEDFGGPAGTSSLPYLRREQFPDEPVFIVIYEGNPNEGEAEVRVCAPLPHGSASAPPDGTTVPAHREAYVRVTKDTVQSGRLGLVYQAVEEWVVSQGMEVAGAPRETYWTDFHAAATDAEVFDVAWPIR
jgi:hypothetical protein